MNKKKKRFDIPALGNECYLPEEYWAKETTVQ